MYIQFLSDYYIFTKMAYYYLLPWVKITKGNSIQPSFFIELNILNNSKIYQLYQSIQVLFFLFIGFGFNLYFIAILTVFYDIKFHSANVTSAFMRDETRNLCFSFSFF